VRNGAREGSEVRNGRTTALIVLIALGVIVAGCGGSSESGSGSDDTTAAETTAVEKETVSDVVSEETTASDERFSRENWDVLASDPDSYKGASVDIVGKVFSTVERDAEGVYFQMWADPKESELNTVVAAADTSLRLKDGDFVHVKGEVRGVFEGENSFGAELTLPSVIASSVKVVDATAAASRALKTLGRIQGAQYGITVTVRKVELAEDETRVFVAVKNGSSEEFSIYSFNAKAVQGGRQFEPETNFDYPELVSEILPGAFTSGVITFPALTPDRGLDLVLEGSSSNYDIGDFGTLTWRFHW
jgi:hypothetical protein